MLLSMNIIYLMGNAVKNYPVRDECYIDKADCGWTDFCDIDLVGCYKSDWCPETDETWNPCEDFRY